MQRYAARLNAVEINPSFYRSHPSATYARWAASVPDNFRFSVKLSRTITHQQRLGGCGELLDDFLRLLRQRHAGPVALEPRHASWFTAPADSLLHAWNMGRVRADPVVHEAGRLPGGFAGLVYVRLHGSPRMYYSAYDRTRLEALKTRLEAAAQPDAAVWCIFDNTAEGAAIDDALHTLRGLAPG